MNVLMFNHEYTRSEQNAAQTKAHVAGRKRKKEKERKGLGELTYPPPPHSPDHPQPSKYAVKYTNYDSAIGSAQWCFLHAHSGHFSPV